MIYFTTFLLTLILSHIARAVPACGDVAPPEELYDPMYPDYADRQYAVPTVPPTLLYNVTWSSYYDNPNGDTKKVACSNLAGSHPHFKDFHCFPFIGGEWHMKKGSKNCGTCWNLINVHTHKTVRVTVIDSAKSGHYNISKAAFEVLNGGHPGTWLFAEARMTSCGPCGSG